jgi:multimeric flavodoxin WrbA
MREGERVLIIIGSARVGGNTASAARRVCNALGRSARTIDLLEQRVGAFDYRRSDDRDDFRSIVGLMAASDHIVFATPVYWYAMSGVMKTFFDRLTDLLNDRQHRTTGRALAGREAWLIATGTDPEMPAGFSEPFVRTADYFDMEWRGAAYCRSIDGSPLTDEDLKPAVQLAERISLS